MKIKLSSVGLSSNQLKLFAIFVMTIDHIGAFLLPQYSILRIIGRLAMPIFAFMIAEGCRYTKNRLKYLATMVGFAIVCQLIKIVLNQDPLEMSIMVTFSFSVLLIYTMDFASKKKSFLSFVLMGGVFCVVCFICVFLHHFLPVPGFNVDYRFIGVLLPVFIYVGRTHQEKLMLCAGGLAALGMMGFKNQWYAFLSLPLLAIYNGTRGKHSMKYLFYVYYPAHLAVIYVIKHFLK